MNGGKAAYLKLYDKWLREGKPGLAPSPLPFGLLSGDCTNEVCELESAQRRETGRSVWEFYDPKFLKPFMAELRRKAGKADDN